MGLALESVRLAKDMGREDSLWRMWLKGWSVMGLISDVAGGDDGGDLPWVAVIVVYGSTSLLLLQSILVEDRP